MQTITFIVALVAAGLVYYASWQRHPGLLPNITALGFAASIVVLGILLDASMVFVPFGSADIVTMNGALTNTILQPGLNFKIPFVQGVWRMNTQIRALSVANSSVFTKDQQNADNDYTINFSLDDNRLKEIAQDFRGEGEDTSIADRLIQPRAEYWLKQIEPTYNAADLLTHRSDVANRLLERLQKELSPYGVQLAFVSLTNISFGPQYQQASEARAAAEQDYQKEITVLKTKKVLAQQTEALAAGQARANDDLRNSLPSDPREAEVVVQLQMIQLLRDKWNGTLPSALGSGSILSIAQPASPAGNH
jgi:regulator of protease activity HflC (stomatin/prohibitin superfamily)